MVNSAVAARSFSPRAVTRLLKQRVLVKRDYVVHAITNVNVRYMSYDYMKMCNCFHSMIP
jgi:hypothetical protein